MEKTHPMAPAVYRPLMDWWVTTLVVCFILVMLASILLVLWSPLVTRWIGLVSALVLVGMLIWFIDGIFYSFYVLDNEGLMVVSHLRHLSFPYRNMRTLKAGGAISLISYASYKRFALSRKNVIIKLANEHWRAISVSPKDRDAFINHILERIDHERSRRAARQRQTHASK